MHRLRVPGQPHDAGSRSSPASQPPGSPLASQRPPRESPSSLARPRLPCLFGLLPSKPSNPVPAVCTPQLRCHFSGNLLTYSDQT